jgi:hypothetical protein
MPAGAASPGAASVDRTDPAGASGDIQGVSRTAAAAREPRQSPTWTATVSCTLAKTSTDCNNSVGNRKRVHIRVRVVRNGHRGKFTQTWSAQKYVTATSTWVNCASGDYGHRGVCGRLKKPSGGGAGGRSAAGAPPIRQEPARYEYAWLSPRQLEVQPGP